MDSRALFPVFFCLFYRNEQSEIELNLGFFSQSSLLKHVGIFYLKSSTPGL